MTYEKIRYHVENGVAVILLDDPAFLNATSMVMGEELLDAVERSATARAVLLGSVGRAFCSGAQLSAEGLEIDNPERDVGTALERYFNPVVRRLRDLPVPVVTAVRGAAVGVGCGLALCGDIIVAGEGAFFLQAFRSVGLVPDGASSYLLARAIGRVRAMDMMMLGQRLPAAKALDWGLVTRVVPDEEVDSHALSIAEELAQGPRSLGMIKSLAWAALDAPMDEQLDRERALQRDAGRTSDFVEGATAFMERRPPRFEGR